MRLRYWTRSTSSLGHEHIILRFSRRPSYHLRMPSSSRPLLNLNHHHPCSTAFGEHLSSSGDSFSTFLCLAPRTWPNFLKLNSWKCGTQVISKRNCSGSTPLPIACYGWPQTVQTGYSCLSSWPWCRCRCGSRHAYIAFTNHPLIVVYPNTHLPDVGKGQGNNSIRSHARIWWKGTTHNIIVFSIDWLYFTSL